MEPMKARQQCDSVQIMQKTASSFKSKFKVLVISQVRHNKIVDQLSVQLTNFAIHQILKQSESFAFYSYYTSDFPQTNQITCDKLDFVDLVLVVGCNQTLMYSFNKFESVNSPPILGFSVEGQSTLYNFTKCNMDETLTEFVKKAQSKQGLANNIEEFSKLQFSHNGTKIHATCQIQISRGPKPALVKLELYIKSQQSQAPVFICKLWGDGLVISTSYGSVSRNIMLNGPIIHKKIPCMIITPVCPLSLKFRPLCLPIDTCELLIKVEPVSRVGGTVYMDGVKTGKVVQPGEQFIIKKSCLKSVMVSNLKKNYEQTLIQNLTEFLSWGKEFSSAPNYQEQIKMDAKQNRIHNNSN